MSAPRQILPGQCYLLSRRCTQRQLLLQPGAEVNNAFVYCLAEAAARFGIVILLSVAEANHHHTVFYDPKGRAPQFIEHFHRTLARCLNAFRGRYENFWNSSAVSYVRLLDLPTLIAKLVYAAINPVKDHLVARVHHWPGVHTLAALRTGRAIRATRPRFFFDRHGAMPATVEASRCRIPAHLGRAADILAAVDAGVAEAERAADAERAATGKRVLGRKAALLRSWRDAPRSQPPRRTLNPRFAGTAATRIPALRAYKEFLACYRDARAQWLAGPRASVTFPLGTYALARLAPVVAAVGPPPT